MTTLCVRWNQVALEAIRVTHPGPPIVARALAVLHTAMYDAWAPYDEIAVGTRLGALLRRPAAERTIAHKREAISFAAYRTLSDLFASEQGEFDKAMADLGLNPADTTLDPATPAGVGNLAAQAVLEFRHGDGSNQSGTLHPGAYSDWTGYAPVNTPDVVIDPARWQPLRISDGHGGTTVQSFIAPHWGQVIGFALPDGPLDPPPAPAAADSESYRIQAQDVLHYSARLDDRDKVIAEYWADGPASELPPGHWCLFAAAVSARDHNSLDTDVLMFLAMTNAVLDASITAWDAKRRSDYVRPVTAIHYLFTGVQVRAWAGPGLGTAMIDGGDWQPYQAETVVSPPFAEYYSGHSVFSAAAAEVLRRFTGSDAFGLTVTIAAGSSRVEPGLVPASDLTLHWDTFSAAADEAGLSRRYGGIHFEDGDRVGRAVGRTLGARAFDLATRYREGTV